MNALMWNPRRSICTMLDSRLQRRLKPFEVADWDASAVVFAPHPDDETLGCGGVAARKIAAGVKVRFVFVTDGAASHPGLAGGDDLRATREAEAIEAVRRLGGSAEDVVFLRFPDGSATEHLDEMTQAIAPLLDAWRPQSIYVPHAKEPPPDHTAVNAAVLAALRKNGHTVTVYEYPVWYWYHWPWTTLSGDMRMLQRLTVRQTIRTAAGSRALTTLNRIADVGDVLEVKRNALAAHVSQTERPENKDDWKTLADLSGGDFIRRLLADHEMFTCYRFDPAAAA